MKRLISDWVDGIGREQVLTELFPSKKEIKIGLYVAIGFLAGHLMVAALCLLGLIIDE